MSTLSDFEFDSLQFEDYVQPTFSSLFNLLRESKECDTKMSVLNVMSVVVDKMGDKLSKDAESLCHYLPLLWNESQDHNMLRCAILSALVRKMFNSFQYCLLFNSFDTISIFLFSLVTNYCRYFGNTTISCIIFISSYRIEYE